MPEGAEVLDRRDELGASRERVPVDDIRECLGRDAFGPALLTLGLVALSPVGDIPGAPTFLSIFIVSVGVQWAAGRSEPWLPRALAVRSFKAAACAGQAACFDRSFECWE